MVTTPTNLISHIKESDSVKLIHNEETVNAVGKTVPIYIGNSNQVTLLVHLTAIGAGAPAITYQINVIEAISAASIKSYAGTAISSVTPGTDYILVSGVTLGDWIEVEWTGTLNAGNYYTGVTARLVVK